MMGSYMNFKNFVEPSQPEPDVNFPLVRQSSIFSLTFDELQNTLGGTGKEFGSMNMDELLKNIWTTNETQSAAPSCAPGANLQTQGSLSLPRTLSQKTVDEVWRDLFKESSGANEGSGGGGSGGGGEGRVHLPQREPTLGEMTLEDFLVRAGVVREDAQPISKPSHSGFFSEISQTNGNNKGLSLGSRKSARDNALPANQITGNHNSVANPQPQPLFPKQATVAIASCMPLVSNAQLAVGMVDPSINNGVVQGSFVQSGGVQGRKCGGVIFEKAIEKRQKRMVKNRESAARSRARKQAYTLELEAEIEKLKEINQELQKKQEEIMEMQKNQESVVSAEATMADQPFNEGPPGDML
ncbi:hypothetical protein RHSIM_Rhsim05G0085200 [Rhododendron simsii]|uniref:BZIP domain-containing protein n=1 Tax=Rhododendron simsii TaxID=118357 RepID=A0A834LMZ2_RHOSS|nr:hypothetical protein RHSIM_Rhsim05G0085200 [Rhododendron simsii]